MSEDLGAELLGRTCFAPVSELHLAVSGGPDSMALLALACRTGARVVAFHVDHGLRPGSDAEGALVERVGRRLGAEVVRLAVEVAPGPNLEARAREARWRSLPADAATGHTADDQAETVLLNMLRGSGGRGLSAMRAGGRHPILRLRRAETAALCRELNLPTVEDPSNADPRFVRNRIRHEVLPLLAAVSRRDPVPLLCRQADLLAEDDAFLEDLAAGLDPTDAAGLREAPAPLARRALRAWLGSTSAYPPTSAEVARALAVARGEAVATELGGGRRLRRRRGVLVLEPPARKTSAAGDPAEAGSGPRPDLPGDLPGDSCSHPRRPASPRRSRADAAGPGPATEGGGPGPLGAPASREGLPATVRAAR